MGTYPLPASSFTSLGYFYANSSSILGAFSKDTDDQSLIRVDYSGVEPSSVAVVASAFSVDVGSAPPLQISNVMFDGNCSLFIVSEGVPGVSYVLSIASTFSNGSQRVDTLGVKIPAENIPVSLGITNTINVGNPITGNGAVYINSGPRYFVLGTPPAAPNLLDIWYNTANKTIYIYTTDGTGINNWLPFNSIPSILSELLYSEQLTVTGINTLSALTYVPDGQTIMLIINNQVFLPIGPSPAFTWSGKNIIWLSTMYNINVGDDVKAIYSTASSVTPITPPSSSLWADISASQTITSPGWYIAKMSGITLTLGPSAKTGESKFKAFAHPITIVDSGGATFDAGVTSFILTQPNQQITLSWSAGDSTWVVGG